MQCHKHIDCCFCTVYTVKKVKDFPSPAGMSLTRLSLDGNTVVKLFPSRESLVSDIPTGDGKIANLFLYSVNIVASATYRLVEKQRIPSTVYTYLGRDLVEEGL
jgi:hypothetical protein